MLDNLRQALAVRQPLPPRGVVWIVLGFVVLVWLNLPQVLIKGRFFAEEAAYFFAYAWHQPWQDALWHPLGGYLNLVATGGTLLTVWLVRYGGLPMEYAPYITIAMALIIQLLPIWLILVSRADWLEQRGTRLAAAMIPAIMPLTEEVFLHTLHSQFHLTLAVALLLGLDVPSRIGLRILRLLILLLAPLAGPTAIALLPFMVLRALLDRSRYLWLEVTVLALGATVQLVWFFSPDPTRSHMIGPAMMAGLLFVRHAVLPLAGIGVARGLGVPVLVEGAAGLRYWLLAAFGALTFGALAWQVLRRWRSAPAWLIIPGLWLALMGYAGGITTGLDLFQVGSGQRYSFVPMVLLAWGLLAIADAEWGLLSRIGRWLSGLVLVIGVASLPSHNANLVTGPDWRAEVAQWRKDPAHPLALWPAGWTADLSPNSQNCHQNAQLAWCDGAWAARQAQERAQMAPKQP